MVDVYILASYCDQGKIIVALALEQYLRKQGYKVACLQKIKGQSDVGLYLRNRCYQYNLPLEAAQSRDMLEQWLPVGYDKYIICISTAYSPVGTAFLDLFNSYNEIIPYAWENNWSGSVQENIKSYSNDPGLLIYWERMRAKYRQEKKVQDVITGITSPYDGPALDNNSCLNHPEKLISDIFKPKMILPQSNRKAIAVGAFPVEFWDIFPELKWYDYDYITFIERINKENFDMAIIGECNNPELKLPIKPKTKTICYQPTVYLPDCRANTQFPKNRNQDAIYEHIKKKPIGTQFPDSGFSYRYYNNRFWVYQTYPGKDIVQQDDNIVYCNGWILPQFLIRDGYLEVS